jgi:hypothetical protein
VVYTTGWEQKFITVLFPHRSLPQLLNAAECKMQANVWVCFIIDGVLYLVLGPLLEVHLNTRKNGCFNVGHLRYLEFNLS